MSDLTFLTDEQCFGSERFRNERFRIERLDILKKRGSEAAITDFAILLGGRYNDSFRIGDESLEERIGSYWTKSCYKNGNVGTVNSFDTSIDSMPSNRGIGARPALPFSSIFSIPTNGEAPKRAKDDVLEVECGYYPQKAVSIDM